MGNTLSTKTIPDYVDTGQWTEILYLLTLKEMLRIEDRDVSISNLTAPTEKTHYEFFVTVIRQPLSAGHGVLQ